MASRTSTSVGVGVALTLLGLTSLGLFVTSAVLYGKWNQTQRELNDAKVGIRDFISDGERQQDDIRQIAEAARKAGRQSLVGYLVKSNKDLATAITGNGNDSIDRLLEQTRAESAKSNNQPLLRVAQDRSAQIEDLTKQLEQANSARLAAQADLKSEQERVAGIVQRHNESLAALNSEVGTYKGQLADYRSGIDTVQNQMQKQFEAQLAAGKSRETELNGKISDLQQRSLILEDQLARLRGERSKTTARGTAEEALVDGTIIGVNATQKQVFLSIGRRQKVNVGMTFAVYNDANSIKQDSEGNYKPGKATVEVVNVGEDSSTARIISETRGNPIVNGDVIANAAFDPDKIYKFVVFGNFDTKGTGMPTAAGRTDVAAMVTSWGGEVVDDLDGDVDFLVLGAKPVLPPRPGVDQPIEVVQEYVRLERSVNKYNEMLKQATSMGLPVLNENRFYTLVGLKPVSRKTAQ
ncbi:MAG: FlgT C-terminal domain-containing protein [Phycisphaerales bacterium]|nr:hypothetical protein [Planctomycetota bacterium]